LWQDDNEDWHEYDTSSQQLIEESINNKETNSMLLINGRSYTLDFVSMKQFNVQSGHARNVKKVEKRSRRPESSIQADQRFLLWQEESGFYDNFIKQLFFLIYEAHITMEHPLLRSKSLQCILRNVYYARKETLLEILKCIPISSHLAMLLKDSDLRIVVGCIQLADILMQKLPEIFHLHFRREGVMHQMRATLSQCLKLSDDGPVPEPAKKEPVVTTPSSGFERFSSVLRRSSNRLKRLLSKRDHNSDSNEEPSSGPAQVSKPPKAKQARVSRRMLKHAQWTVTQSKRLLSAWNFNGSLDSHEAFIHLKNLQSVTSRLQSKDQQMLRKALEELRGLFSSSETCPTSFEIMHCELMPRLLHLLAEECHERNPLWLSNVHCFLLTFCGLEKSDSCESFKHLIRQLHMCLNHVERFPVVSPSLYGSKDVGSMSFLSNRPLNCQLERHPSDSDFSCKKLDIGLIRIHPLASIKTVEHFLLSKGCYQKPKAKSHTKQAIHGTKDKTGDDMTPEKCGETESTHTLELLVGDTVLPYHITVVEALIQNPSSNFESRAMFPHSFWARTHTIYYRKLESDTVLTASESPSSAVRGFSSESKHSVGLEVEQLHGNQKKLKWLCNEIIRSFPQSSEQQYLLLKLIRILYLLHLHWQLLVSSTSTTSRCGSILSDSDFINHYLASKVARQLQDGLTIVSGHFSWWLTNLPRLCPFLFPFDLRLKLFYTTSFGRERAIIRMQETQADANDVEGHDKVTPQLEKCKHRIQRQNILLQTESILKDLSSRKMLEIEYDNEVGTGSGPTMEFYTLVSRELQRTDLHLWRGDTYEAYDSSAETHRQYYMPKNGLFPAPLSATASTEEEKQRCHYFHLIGKFLARTLLDSRLIDMHLSHSFYKWMLEMQDSFTLSDLQDVDPIFASSYTYLQELVSSEESDQVQANVESLGLNFTLPGYPDIELKPGGRKMSVTYKNLPEYLELVFDWTMSKGVERQFTALKNGFNTVFPLHYLSIFHPEEISGLLCGSQLQMWNIRELQEHVKLDHGYTYDSKVVHCFFQILTNFNRDEQEKFLQFVTGSPRLPIGGFSSLNPPLTVVRKSVEQGTNPDTLLPSVMTCVNYLKLPPYNSMEVMKERILTALNQGLMSFHLS
jgi:E3 ubiquitin-protein ligase TRIP12